MARKKRSSSVIERPAESVEEAPQNVDSVEQSGDLQGLSDDPDADSESVRELVEEGQFYEAEVISGVGNAPLADEGPVRIHRRQEDDVAPEYTERRQDEPTE